MMDRYEIAWRSVRDETHGVIDEGKFWDWAEADEVASYYRAEHGGDSIYVANFDGSVAFPDLQAGISLIEMTTNTLLWLSRSERRALRMIIAQYCDRALRDKLFSIYRILVGPAPDEKKRRYYAILRSQFERTLLGVKMGVTDEWVSFTSVLAKI